MTALAKPLPRRAAGALQQAPAAAPWLIWTCLGIVYVVWGSTYLAIRVMVETVPPMLGAGARFFLAGAILLALMTAVGRARRPTRRQLAGAAIIGTALCGANAVVTVAEVSVPSGLAALLVAAMPLFVIVLRRLTGDTIGRATAVGVVTGFVGVALLLLPGERPDGASLVGMLAIVAAASLWATGSFASPRTELPPDLFVSSAWQMLAGGVVCLGVGVAMGEVPDVRPAAFSTDSMLAWLYLVTMGSLVAFSAYIWLLEHAPVSKVATYAYVNPVIAIFLGWLILGEAITSVTALGATIIVASVAVVVRVESRRA